MREVQDKVLEKEEQKKASLLLALEDVSILYDGVSNPIVENIHFSLHEGESVLFLGPSGCGKSTLAMLCGGLIPRSVEAKVTGRVWFHPDMALPGGIGYVFQDPDSQFCMLNVADEIAFGLENISMKKDEMEPQITKSLHSADLDVPLHANHASFSGGMKQKLAIASALALNPQLLILDEPTANLDPHSTSQVFRQIASLRKSKQSMIVIEHKFKNLIPLMDTVVLFDHDGKIHRVGAAAKVISEEWNWMVSEGIVEHWKQSQNGSREKIFSINRKSADEVRPSFHANEACHLEHVFVERSKKNILHDISLDIREGEFVAILGPNGAGKSTLLQTMAGLLRQKNGNVFLFEKRLSRVSRRDVQTRIAYCFQNPEFQFIYETVSDELANRRVGTRVPSHVVSQLSEFGLCGTEMLSPYSLSQGQKRRLSVAAMLREAHDIFFLDEPTFGQDASTKEAIMEKLRALNEIGKTVVMTTHDVDLANNYATKIIVVIEGEIRFVGSFTELKKDKSLLREAHLDETIAPEREEENIKMRKSVWNSAQNPDSYSNLPIESVKRKFSLVPPVKLLHPVWLLINLLVVTGITLQANTLMQSLATFIFAFFVMMIAGFMTPWKIGKLLLPFIGFYMIYIWSFAANAAIPVGTKSIHMLWMNVSMYGLTQGVILAIRMLTSVLFGIFYIVNMDMSSLMVGLSKDFRVPPKFAYGTLAGLRVVPLFAGEWTKLRQARQIRGKDARFFYLRPIVYSLPLLSQAIRMSERVAIAMEARGFIDESAASAKGRTYYRELKVHFFDFIVAAFMIVCAILTVRAF